MELPKREAADREQAVAVAYERRLSELADREEESWSQVDALIQERNATSYTIAASLLDELAESAAGPDGATTTNDDSRTFVRRIDARPRSSSASTEHAGR